MIVLSLVSPCRSSFAATLVDGWAFVLLVALGGFFLQSTLPVNVTFGQALAPVSAATVSSLMMGFAWGSGGLTVPIVGRIADLVRDSSRRLRGLALVPLAAAALALPLPPRPSDHVRRSRRRTRSEEPRRNDSSYSPEGLMSRYASRLTPRCTTHSDQGPLTPAVKWLIIANVGDVRRHAGLPHHSVSLVFPPSW